MEFIQEIIDKKFIVCKRDIKETSGSHTYEIHELFFIPSEQSDKLKEILDSDKKTKIESTYTNRFK